MRTKTSSELSLHDKLSRLTLNQVEKLLGPKAAAMIPKAGATEIDIATQVLFSQDVFQVAFPNGAGVGKPVVVNLALHPSYRNRLQVVASHDDDDGLLCRAAALSLILEEKTALGLAAPPDENTPLELLSEEDLVRRALAERESRAKEEKMAVRSKDRTTPWTDYVVASAASGKSYRVALRGLERGQGYCSCPDFRRNLLGTCKHLCKVQQWIEKKFTDADLRKKWRPDRIGIFARYDGDGGLAMEIPSRISQAAREIVTPWEGRTTKDDADCVALFDAVRQLTKLDEDVVVYPDAEEYLNRALHRHHLRELVTEIRKNPAEHPLRTTLLNTELLPYQLDGIAFAAGAGRAVLADEMGLGKTIQGVGVAELLAQHAGVRRVLIVCPASLKSQWRSEILRFSGRSVQLVTGRMSERAGHYAGGAFFTVCNYEQVLRDYLDIERASWDLIILDEAQRIKNWEAKTTRIIKSLRSRLALVLTGTPLENRLDDLFSVVEFIDERRLGPAYRFLHAHREVDEKGKVLGYKNLDVLRERLRPILLRRTRASVAMDLPGRKTEIVRIPPTDEQKAMNNAHLNVVQMILSKAFISEMDLLRLQRALLMARMSANSTYLVDKQPPGYSSKLGHLTELLETLCGEPERKIILFSEWTTMLNLVEPILKRLKAEFVRLDGSVPQKQRAKIVHRFQTDPSCRAFLATNAGSTGLNLQAADTVINIDLPWNPAVLEQRISRAYRMGQKRKVHAYLLVTEGTIEENLLATLSAKQELASAVLDPDSDLREVQISVGMDQLKRRLEVLLGACPEAAPDITVQERTEAEATSLAERKSRVSEAGGQLLGAAFSFIGELLPTTGEPPAPEAVAAVKNGLQQCIETGEDGKPRLTVTLPGSESLDALAAALARLLAVASNTAVSAVGVRGVPPQTGAQGN